MDFIEESERKLKKKKKLGKSACQINVSSFTFSALEERKESSLQWFLQRQSLSFFPNCIFLL